MGDLGQRALEGWYKSAAEVDEASRLCFREISSRLDRKTCNIDLKPDSLRRHNNECDVYSKTQCTLVDPLVLYH